MARHARSKLDQQDRDLIRTFDLPWYVDEESGNVRIRHVTHLPELLNFLKVKKGFTQEEAEWRDKFRRSHGQDADFLVTVVGVEGDEWTRDHAKSFIEITNPSMNDYIKEELLGLKSPKQR